MLTDFKGWLVSFQKKISGLTDDGGDDGDEKGVLEGGENLKEAP